MVNWKEKLKGNPIPWLLEADETQPAIRYYTLHDILGRDENDKEVKTAKAAIMASGPVPVILEGYWDKPGFSFRPKYRRTEYTLINMAQLGADGADQRIHAGCEILLSRYIDSNGGLSFTGTPSDFNHCTAGIMGAALIDFGWLEDQRLLTVMFWQISFIVVDAITQDPVDGAVVYVDHVGYVENGGTVIVPFESIIYHKAKVGDTWSEKTGKEVDETWAQCTYQWDGIGFSPPSYE